MKKSVGMAFGCYVYIWESKGLYYEESGDIAYNISVVRYTFNWRGFGDAFLAVVFCLLWRVLFIDRILASIYSREGYD